MRRAGLIIGLGVAIVLIAVVGVMATSKHGDTTKGGNSIPLAEVQKGDLDLKVYTTGELRATSYMVLAAPPVAGGALQITRLLHPGTLVKKGDLVFEFDPAEQHYKLEQSRSEVQQADQEIIKANADAAVQAAQDKVNLLKARFDVRKAELEVQKNELVSAIDAKKNQLTLEQAQRALAKLEQDIQSHKVTGQAAILLANEKKNKARLSMTTATENIQKMRVTAPMAGLVAIEKNEGAMGDIGFPGMTIPEYRAGDQVQPGSSIAQVIDPKKMELTGKVGERDRNNIGVGQPVEVEFDSLPGRKFRGSVKTLGGMSVTPMFSFDATGGFDISIQLLDEEPSLRPGLTAQLVILGDKKNNVLYLPAQALLMKDGKRVVYVKHGQDFEQRSTKVLFENESHAAVEGLAAGDKVALLDPTVPRKSESSGTSSAMGGGKP